MREYELQIAELFVRLLAGMLFMFQGFDKLFRIRMPAVIDVFALDAKRAHIPVPILKIISWLTSMVEFGAGLLLIAGLWTTFALYALGIDLLLVSFAFTYMKPMWDLSHVFPRFILLIFLLVVPPQARVFTLDHLLKVEKT